MALNGKSQSQNINIINNIINKTDIRFIIFLTRCRSLKFDVQLTNFGGKQVSGGKNFVFAGYSFQIREVLSSHQVIKTFCTAFWGKYLLVLRHSKPNTGNGCWR
jgi:hypothetical protein